ncbi:MULTISPECIES: 2-hydroxycarboxylate transporter family protein [unclassified Pyramidobacter]|uniref:2-hydroxycarboxylate transporter family protein n=1 Tax=unclassified Pyramidobacter TaxID=2632171 RepID=UPI000EA3289D|nr:MULTISPECIES: 2-hydroxycarboxylate transporter family protein [unclassified Pyramidobacter]RKJ77055.1 citrate:sodium symporter [Pyramidobacter sp. CG50-2]WOL39503.1 2-hydroxycarboxylate transporter family protein [Pyramidobacter sp. YE332]
MSEESKSLRLFNMPWQIFAVFAAIVLVATYMGVLPKGMIGAFPFMIVVGAVLNEIGNRCPIVNTYLGGGAIVIIFGMATLCYYHLIPDATVKIVTNFMKGEGFLDFYIAALICGSILGMNRDLLIRAAIRYLPAIVGGVAVAIGLAGLVGELTGYGAKQAILYIAVPIMGGGMGAGAVPLSKIFGETLAQKPEDIINIMIPAVALGNAMAIVAGGLLSKLGKSFPCLTGNGDLLITKGADDAIQADEEFLKKRDAISLTVMGVGLLLATAFFAWGRIVAFFIPKIHSYAWMIISVAVVKALGILPQYYEICCYQWFQFVMKNLTAVLLAGIGVAYTDLGQIISAFSGQYLLLVGVTVFGAIIGSGLVGRLVGFYPVESAITAGLCMANMGGTGDVAVLSAAHRMELMPFAQISSRIGGAFMLILASVLLQII